MQYQLLSLFYIHQTTHYHNISHRQACSMNKKQPKPKPKPLGEQLNQAKIIKLALHNKILFEGNVKIQQYDAKSANLDRLKKILNEELKYQFKQQEIQEFFTPPSRDVGFDVDRIDQSIMKDIKQFKEKEFYQQVMYKEQSSFFAPNYQQIMLASEQPLAHSILQIKQSYQKQAIRVFNIILSIGKQTSISKQFQQTQILINCLHGARQQIINQSFMQLLKQSNNHLEHTSIKILQEIPVFLHIFTPSKHFLLFSLFFLLSLAKSPHSSQKLQKYLFYSISKIINKYQHKHGSSYVLSFKPIKHQIISLLCRKVLTIPVYLPMGSHVYIQVQEYDSFGDLKARALKEFGINASGRNRIMDQLWGCFEIVNVNNQKIEENYLEDDGNVWDVETYWRKAQHKYRETGIQHAMFFIMIKIKIGFQCHFEDEEGVEILFSQCFYEYFTGKIILEFKEMCLLAACLKKLKFSDNQDYKHLFPIWAIKKFSEAELLQKISQNIKRFQSQLCKTYP